MTTLVFGAQSPAYFGAVLAGFALTMPLAWYRSSRIPPAAYLVVFLPVLLTAVQAITLPWPAFEPPSLLEGAAVSAVLVSAVLAGLLSREAFRRTMTIIAIIHVGVCLYGLSQWGALIATGRFQVLTFDTAVWAEIALGTFVAAILSGRRIVILAAIAPMVVIIWGTQMRGAGLAAAAAIIVLALAAVPPPWTGESGGNRIRMPLRRDIVMCSAARDKRSKH